MKEKFYRLDIMIDEDHEFTGVRLNGKVIGTGLVHVTNTVLYSDEISLSDIIVAVSIEAEK